MEELDDCIIDCGLSNITTGRSCNLKGGIKKAFWTLYDNVYWDAMTAAPNFDPATQCILNFAMVDDAVWNSITFEREGSEYTQSYTSDNSSADINLNFLFNGKGKEFRNAVCKALGCCDIIIYTIGANCDYRLFGADWDGNAWNPYIKGLRITQWDDNSGTSGGDNPSDVINFGGTAECMAMYGEIDQSTFQSTYL